MGPGLIAGRFIGCVLAYKQLMHLRMDERRMDTSETLRLSKCNIELDWTLENLEA